MLWFKLKGEKANNYKLKFKLKIELNEENKTINEDGKKKIFALKSITRLYGFVCF